ncbi:MAG: aspartate-semialdehyde dehydrogenase [Myxococcota bacterium]
MAKSFHTAVVGATGLVGREMLAVLEERGFPVSQLSLLASTRSVGEVIAWQGEDHTVQIAGPDSFAGVDIVLMSAGSAVSEHLAPLATRAGAVVIDNSSQWRMDPAVPLVVPEVNPEAIGEFKNKRIIANPNCSTIQMVVALNPLHQEAGLKRVVVSTYQAVSGKGKAAMDELASQVSAIFNQRDITMEVFPTRISFNCIPHIDVFQEDRFTKEEHKMRDETRKIMGLPDLGVCATCVRVPVFNGHAESVVAEFDRPISASRARDLLREGAGLFVHDSLEDNGYPTQISCEGSDATLVGRVREDPSAPNSLAFWCVADNLRKGAASNAVQIAEILARDHLQ